MPQFGHQDGFDTVWTITGPCHVLLGIRFGETESGSIELIKRSRVGGCNHAPLDERRILEAVQLGIAAANAETGAQLTATVAFYVEDDSPDYRLYERCAYLLACRRSRTGK
jgi:hypothetical protein